jgi:hypothetical protein
MSLPKFRENPIPGHPPCTVRDDEKGYLYRCSDVDPLLEQLDKARALCDAKNEVLLQQRKEIARLETELNELTNRGGIP